MRPPAAMEREELEDDEAKLMVEVRKTNGE
jgi:hypothetical protein